MNRALLLLQRKNLLAALGIISVIAAFISILEGILKYPIYFATLAGSLILVIVLVKYSPKIPANVVVGIIATICVCYKVLSLDSVDAAIRTDMNPQFYNAAERLLSGELPHEYFYFPWRLYSGYLFGALWPSIPIVALDLPFRLWMIILFPITAVVVSFTSKDRGFFFGLLLTLILSITNFGYSFFTEVHTILYLGLMIICLNKGHYLGTGFFLGAVAATKLTSLAFVPVLIAYFLRKHGIKAKELWHLLVGFGVSLGVFILPTFLWNPEGFLNATVLNWPAETARNYMLLGYLEHYPNFAIFFWRAGLQQLLMPVIGVVVITFTAIPLIKKMEFGNALVLSGFAGILSIMFMPYAMDYFFIPYLFALAYVAFTPGSTQDSTLMIKQDITGIAATMKAWRKDSVRNKSLLKFLLVVIVLAIFPLLAYTLGDVSTTTQETGIGQYMYHVKPPTGFNHTAYVCVKRYGSMDLHLIRGEGLYQVSDNFRKPVVCNSTIVGSAWITNDTTRWLFTCAFDNETEVIEYLQNTRDLSSINITRNYPFITVRAIDVTGHVQERQYRANDNFILERATIDSPEGRWEIALTVSEDRQFLPVFIACLGFTCLPYVISYLRSRKGMARKGR